MDKSDIFGPRIEPERESEPPFSADNAAETCWGYIPDLISWITIRIRLKKTLWVVMISETSTAIRATIFSFDIPPSGDDRACRGFFICRRLQGP